MKEDKELQHLDKTIYRLDIESKVYAVLFVLVLTGGLVFIALINN